MANGMPGWESLLQSAAPEACALQAALFTTYDRADERLLVEDIFPILLKLNHEPLGEDTESKYFLLELDEQLKRLHDKIIVVSSILREEASDESMAGGNGIYGWIWRSIRHLTVGRQNKAVQHAKLWLLHWAHPEDGEYLEIVVSSANLTNSAFRQQIQAAWKVCIRLQPQRSTARLNEWGLLPDFIRELALASVGVSSRLDSFVDLLARAECPEGITFVASVPGEFTQQELRRKPWGAAGLKKIMPTGRGVVSASVLSPFIGSWNNDWLLRWCENFEGSPKRFSLIWIDQNHPWAKNWVLPVAAWDTLKRYSNTLRQLRFEPDDNKETDRFHIQHSGSDIRWSHAKAYAFGRGNSRRLLLTSANFSRAAWGEVDERGRLIIKNFELGVCIDQAGWPFEDLNKLDCGDAATSTLNQKRSAAAISWAQASWSGKIIFVECKCEHDLSGRILFNDGKPLVINEWAKGRDGLYMAQIGWVDNNRLPASVVLSSKSESMSVSVFDERQLAVRESSFPTGIDESLVEAMRDQLLFERYGGRVVSEDEPQPDDDGQVGEAEETWDEVGDGQAGKTDSYAVDTFVSARRHLNVVDNWVCQVDKAKIASSDLVIANLLRDGRLLMAAFRRHAKWNGKDAMGARLAAEELELRLKHYA